MNSESLQSKKVKTGGNTSNLRGLSLIKSTGPVIPLLEKRTAHPSLESVPNRIVRHSAGFSLMEVFVTIGVISILAALLSASISNARFKAKVTTCTNNFRQIGIAVNIYTADGKSGRLPSFPLNIPGLEKKGYGSIEPTFVDFKMITALEPAGVLPSFWFCPTRNRWKNNNDVFQPKNNGRSIQTAADLVAYNKAAGAPMVPLDMFWWIPRQLEGLNDARFPDPQVLTTRVPEPWPSRAEDPSAAIQPIASDWLIGGWDNAKKDFTRAYGGHQFRGKARSTNVLFADGRVDTRPFSAVRWQMLNIKSDMAYLY